MNRIWPKWKKLLYPGLPWVILLVALGSVLLFLTFTRELDETPFAYVSYVLSAMVNRFGENMQSRREFITAAQPLRSAFLSFSSPYLIIRILVVDDNAITAR